MIDFIRGLLAKEPARLITYGTTAIVWVAIRGSEAIGSPIAAGSETALAIATVATFILTEAVRHFVYSPASYDAK